jgi:hypothetical protein
MITVKIADPSSNFSEFVAKVNDSHRWLLKNIGPKNLCWYSPSAAYVEIDECYSEKAIIFKLKFGI